MVSPAFVVSEGAGPIVITAIHAGHELRDDVAAAMALDDATRLREEDPFTDRIAALAAHASSQRANATPESNRQVVPTQILVRRSRFEIDLNRPRATAIYVSPEEAWGLDVWREPVSPDLVGGSLAVYDEFYAELERALRAKVQQHGRVVVLDLHSYNHRRDHTPAHPIANPEINVGTRSADRSRWGTVIDRFMHDLSTAGAFDVRENVKFGGGNMAQWIHATFPTTALALAVEFKKTFMDEWTGEPDPIQLDRLGWGIASTLPGLVEALR